MRLYPPTRLTGVGKVRGCVRLRMEVDVGILNCVSREPFKSDGTDSSHAHSTGANQLFVTFPLHVAGRQSKEQTCLTSCDARHCG